MKDRKKVIDLVKSWHGKNESDGSFKEIIDIYNGIPVSQLPRKIKMSYDWEWCACTWSALAIKLGYTDIMPIEISCTRLIALSKQMGIWIENENRVPELGEGVIYDWDDGSNYKSNDNTGGPEHIGTVIEVNEKDGYFLVEEGNYNSKVATRKVAINGKYIRGFISPKYDDDSNVVTTTEKKTVEAIAKEVVDGKWGNGSERKKRLIQAGYDYNEVQKKVNEIYGKKTTSNVPQNTNAVKTSEEKKATEYAKLKDSSIAGEYKVTAKDGLNVRNGAGTNKKRMVTIPNGHNVKCYGYYTKVGTVKWLYVQFNYNNITYSGFASGEWLTKI